MLARSSAVDRAWQSGRQTLPSHPHFALGANRPCVAQRVAAVANFFTCQGSLYASNYPTLDPSVTGTGGPFAQVGMIDAANKAMIGLIRPQ